MPVRDVPPDGIEVMIGADRIADRIAELTREVAEARLERLLVIPILTGSFVFSADLLRGLNKACLLYTSPSPRDRTRSRMPSSA